MGAHDMDHIDVGQAVQQRDSDEEAARRAVEGVDEQVRKAGGSPEQADAMRIALRYFLLGDEENSRRALVDIGGFKNGTVDRILEQFAEGRSDAAA